MPKAKTPPAADAAAPSKRWPLAKRTMFRSLPKAPSLRELSPQVTEGVPLLFRDRQQDPQGEPAVGPMKGHGAVVALGGSISDLDIGLPRSSMMICLAAEAESEIPIISDAKTATARSADKNLFFICFLLKNCLNFRYVSPKRTFSLFENNTYRSLVLSTLSL